jgi:diacylglycerol kinase family enzyme
MSQPDTIPPKADRVLICVNPIAGRYAVGDDVLQLAQMLREEQFTVDVSTDLAEVAARANAWHAEGRLRALVGVGGDGTAAELANRVAVGVPLTLFPAGTSNLLARYLGFHRNPTEVCRTITTGRILHFDAGAANGRLFLAMIGCGFDADVVRRVHDYRKRDRKGYIGYLSYLKPIFESLRTYAYPEIRVFCAQGDGPIACPKGLAVRWAFVFNLPRYAWGIQLAPGADGTDGQLDLCTFDRGSLWNGLRYIAAAQLGRQGRLSDCRCGRGRAFRITSQEPVPYQLDGDPGGMLPVDVEILPGRMTLVVPGASRGESCPRIQS